jgi:hypothetical protein
MGEAFEIDDSSPMLGGITAAPDVDIDTTR